MPREVSIDDAFIAEITRRITAGKRVRRTLPGNGRLHVDRPLPFLCVHRRPIDGSDPGTDRLVVSEGSYLVAPADSSLAPALRKLVSAIAECSIESFGAFLLFEIWGEEHEPITSDLEGDPQVASSAIRAPGARLLVPRRLDLGGLTDRLQSGIERMRFGGRGTSVEVIERARCAPAGLGALLTESLAEDDRCIDLGLALRPIYRPVSGGEPYPVVLQDLRRQLTRTLRRFFYAFTRERTTHRPPHHHVLGRRAVVRAVWKVDASLAEVSRRFSFLLQVSPVNATRAWKQFREGGCEIAPVLHYRPLAVHPIELKRALYKTPVERIEDPALFELFREKLDELDRQISMLHDIDTPRFLPGSIQVYGRPDAELIRLAEQVLARPRPTGEGVERETIGAKAFRTAAREEIEKYRAQDPSLEVDVRLRDDIAGGIMVSRGRVLIDRSVKIDRARVRGLLHHEVGTHLLTWHNGRSQPFRQLRSGLAGYQELQEGLAVFAEYLGGGLSRSRMRTLAGRVVAVQSLVTGADFLETFRLLRSHGFKSRAAFSITMRVHRGGGFTKDGIYLRGLVQVLDLVRSGGDLDPLLVGKISRRHLPIIRELTWRGVLEDPPLRPLYLSEPAALQRMRRARRGLTVADLMQEAS